MRSMELYDYYHYLVPKFAEKYKLDEDETQELELYFWEKCGHYVGADIGTAPSSYFARCIVKKAEALIKCRVEEEPVVLAGSESIEDTVCNKALLDGIHFALEDCLSTLTPREEKILRLRYYDGLTYEQIGAEFNIGGERVRQIERKALRRLRHPSRARKLKQFLTCTWVCSHEMVWSLGL